MCTIFFYIYIQLIIDHTSCKCVKVETFLSIIAGIWKNSCLWAAYFRAIFSMIFKNKFYYYLIYHFVHVHLLLHLCAFITLFTCIYPPLMHLSLHSCTFIAPFMCMSIYQFFCHLFKFVRNTLPEFNIYWLYINS